MAWKDSSISEFALAYFGGGQHCGWAAILLRTGQAVGPRAKNWGLHATEAPKEEEEPAGKRKKSELTMHFQTL